MPERPTLTTERLILRPFELSDAGEVQRLAGDPAIARYTLNIPHPYENGVAEKWIESHQQNFDEGKSVSMAITARASGALIGAISLMGIVAGHQAELGYWIGVEYWGKGYCTEAGRALVGYAFGPLGLKRVHCSHMSENAASGRVMQKIGMKHEGRRPCHWFKSNCLDDLELYGILIEDWPSPQLT